MQCLTLLNQRIKSSIIRILTSDASEVEMYTWRAQLLVRIVGKLNKTKYTLWRFKMTAILDSYNMVLNIDATILGGL